MNCNNTVLTKEEIEIVIGLLLTELDELEDLLSLHEKINDKHDLKIHYHKVNLLLSKLLTNK